MPLGIEMKLGLVDEDDPLSVLVQCQLAQEEKQLKLARAEQVDFKTNPAAARKKTSNEPATSSARGATTSTANS